VSVILSRPSSAMMKRPVDPGALFWLLHVLLLLALALSVTVWGVMSVVGVRGYELMRFISLAGLFGVACAFFVISRVRASFQGFQAFFEIPVYMTLLAFLEFGAVPISSFLDPDTLLPNLRGETSLFYTALQIVIVGMVAFWLGSAVARSRKPAPAVFDRSSLPGANPHYSTLFFGGGLYLVAIGARLYMLRSGMFSYLMSPDVAVARRAEMQFWMVIDHFGLFALLLFCIESYYHLGDKYRAALFWGIFASECFWSLIGASKGLLLGNLVAVALVSSFAKQRLRMRWLVPAILGLIAIYPVMNQYRSIMGRTGGGVGSSMESATQAMRAAAAQTAGKERTAGHWAAS
jgi:hypothetical protein